MAESAKSPGAPSSTQPIPTHAHTPTSPRAAPPTPQEVQRKLGAPTTVGPIPPLSLSPGTTGYASDERSKSTAMPRRHSHLSSSGLSSTDDEAERSSPPNTSRPLPFLSSISEASQNNALESGSDSDASSIAGPASDNHQGVMGRAIERLKTGVDGARRLDDDVAVKSGYLMKKGERRKAWKKRWFVLRGGKLAMYKNDKEYQLLRLIPLADIHTCAPIELKKYPHAFGIVTPRRTYYIKASSAGDVHSWCDTVQHAKELAAASSTVTSGTESPEGMTTPTRHSTATTPTAAIPIADSSSSSRAGPPPLHPSNHPSGPHSYATTISALSSSPSFTALSPPSPVLSSLTGTSTTAPTSYASSALGPTHPGIRVPPNSLVQGGFGALGLQNSQGQQLELGGVDAGLERLALAEETTSPASLPRGSTATTEGFPSHLMVGSYFTSKSPPRSSTEGSGRPGGISFAPPASPSGVISSSEDEDDPEVAEGDEELYGLRSGTELQQHGQYHPTSQQQQTAPVQAPKAPSGFGDPNKVILSGYLMKQGKRKNWRKRWFVLMSGRLVYSRSHMDPRVHRQIPLTRILDAIEYTAPSSSSHPSSSSRKAGMSSSPLSPPLHSHTASNDASSPDHTFKVITPKRTYLLCAPTEEDEIAWLAALQCLVARKSTIVSGSANPASSSGPLGRAGSLSAPTPAPQPPASVGRKDSISPSSQQPVMVKEHGRQRSVTDAARIAVREGVSSFRERSGGQSTRT